MLPGPRFVFLQPLGQRFQLDKMNFSGKKSTFVEIPENLEVKCKAETENFSTVTAGSKTKETKRKIINYRLVGVINHRGTLFGGHYFGFFQNAANKKWYKFDDSTVTELGNIKDNLNKDAYILLYTRKTQ